MSAARYAFDPDTREVCETLHRYLTDHLYAALASLGSNEVSEVQANADGSAAFVLRWDGSEYVIEVRRPCKEGGVSEAELEAADGGWYEE